MSLTERQQEAIGCKTSLCLSAGAGTGKTKTLVHKYVHFLEKAGSSKHILALTFTEKAAAEMKDRVRLMLSSRTDDRAAILLEDLHWSTIQTFHAFCNKVIRDFPIETGVDPNFTVLDEAQINVILEDALDALFATSDAATLDALSTVMEAIEAKRLRKLLENLYGKRHLTAPFFARIDMDAAAVLDEAQKGLVSDVCMLFATDAGAQRAARELRSLASAHPSDEFLSAASGDLDVLCGDSPPDRVQQAILHLLEVLPQSNYGSKNAFGDDVGALRENMKALRAARDRYKISKYTEADDPEVTAKVMKLLTALSALDRAFIKEVNRLKRARNGIDYQDMLDAVHSLFLRDPEFVRTHFTSRYRYILVDETQDTDKVQLDIIQAILGDSEDARDRLFVVGDPKQSIFFFRDVDVALFKATKDFVINELGGAYLPLDVNHRSTPQIVSLVNAVFEKLMVREDRPWDFKYEPLATSPKRIGHQGSVEMRCIQTVPTDSLRPIAEANEVVSIILESISSKQVYEEQADKSYLPRSAQYKDITILLRTRTNLFFYERALRMAGIPYRVHRGRGFFSRQEVLDLYNLLRFLNDPSDNIALYGVLRSPYFGLSDSELHVIGMAGKGLWLSRLRESASTNDRFRAAYEKLERWRGYAGRESAGDLADRLMVESNIMSVYGGLDAGSEMTSNLNKLRDRLMAMQASGFATLNDAVESLKVSIAEEQNEGEAQVEEETDAVRIMTVHAAKGLEWPIVIVPEIDKPNRPQDTAAVEVDREIGIGVKVVSPTDLELVPDPVMRRIQLQWGMKSKAEFQRLLYVAMTRARDHLYLTGVDVWLKPEKDPIEDGSCWFHLLTGAMGLTKSLLVSGKIPYVDSKNNGGAFKVKLPPPDLGGEWKERIEYEVPERLRALPVESPPPSPPVKKRKNLSPSKRRVTMEDGAREIDEEDEHENEDNKTFGIIVHSVFQGRPAEIVLKEHGIENATLASAIDDMYCRFMQCELMEDVVEERLELPYRGRRGESEEEGIIDRLVKKRDGSWILIDYKTGAPSGPRVEEMKERYRNQMDAYVHAAEELTDQTPRAYLYFTHNGLIVEM